MESDYQRLYAANKTLTKSDSQESGSGGDSTCGSNYLDFSQDDQENVVPTLTSRKAQDKHYRRKEERIKLINSKRNLLPDQYDNLFHYPIAEESSDEHEQENEASSTRKASEEGVPKIRIVDNTYVVENKNNNGARQDRGKLYASTKSVLYRNNALEQWRKNRQATRPRDNRPAFKVYHVDPRDFDFILRNKDPVMAPPVS